MFDRDSWAEIFETISKNKLRTFLSGFTVALGIFIFISLLGLGNGLKNSFKEFFIDDANNVIRIFGGTTAEPYGGFKANRLIEFKNDDIDDIKKNFSNYIQYITPRITRFTNIKYIDKSNNYSLRGVSPAHAIAERTIMMKGRYLNNNDISNKAKHIVIGRLIEKDLFGNKSALSKFVNVGSRAYKVVGVFQDDGGDNEERIAYIPYTTSQLVEKNTDKVGQIIVGFKPEIGLSGALVFDKKLMQFLKKKHKISPTDQKAIFIRNIAEQLNENQMLSTVLKIIVSMVGIGTLIAGIIGISNIMVFVIKERTKEIGIRKAIGATPRKIIGMILHESIFITTISGYVGMFAGVILLKFIGDSLENYFIKNPYIDMGTAIFATILLIFFGALAGYVPAKKAAKIKPIEALTSK